ncbi:hypothetical protein, partial [Rhodopila globiformis]|uniref:hypothetical protein n=1 Tax=Rhodopila globiformis TaxID=1071 RepID=UPI0019591268
AARRSAPVPQRQPILSGIAPDIRVSRVSVSIRKAKAVPWKLQPLVVKILILGSTVGAQLLKIGFGDITHQLAIQSHRLVLG